MRGLEEQLFCMDTLSDGNPGFLPENCGKVALTEKKICIDPAGDCYMVVVPLAGVLQACAPVSGGCYKSVIRPAGYVTRLQSLPRGLYKIFVLPEPICPTN